MTIHAALDQTNGICLPRFVAATIMTVISALYI